METSPGASALARRPRARRGEGDRLRREAIDAATALLARLGDDEALSLRAVAREVGVSAPSLYRHFADKQALVEAVVVERYAELSRVGDEAVAGLADPVDRLFARAEAFVTFGLEHPGHWKVLYEGRATAQLEPPAERTANPGAVLGEPVAADAGALRDAGHPIPGDDPRWTALLLWQAVHGVVSLRINKPTPPWRPALEDTRELVARVLGVAPRA